MASKQLKETLAKIKQQQAKEDARRAAQDEAVHAELVEMADGTGRLNKFLKNNPAAREAADRHRKREVAKGEPGW